LNITDSLKLTAFHYNKSASEKNIEVIVEDANSEFPKVSADKVALAEVLSNLVSNAVKNSPKNGKVRLRVSKHGSDHLRVIVSDEGSGVPEESQNRIFERFYRGPGQETNGVGLGLFISREIMRAHEGRIGLCERKSNLTEFYVDVPID
jgi:signal transduction histidine kinase